MNFHPKLPVEVEAAREALVSRLSFRLSDIMFDDYDAWDPWSWGMTWAFALNDAAELSGAETDESYSPGAAGPACEGYEWEALCALSLTGPAIGQDVAELECAIRAFSDYLDTIRELGLDY